MSEPTCVQCGAEFDRRQGRQTYCSASCRNKAKYRRKVPRTPTYTKVCVQCGESFEGGALALYCSGLCANRAKYLREKADGTYAVKTAATKVRYNSDPEFRQRILDRQTDKARARGIEPRRDLRDPVCTVPDCERRHLAKGLCSMHWKRTRTVGVGVASVLLDGIASLYGMAVPKVKTVRVRVLDNGGALVRCPWCSSTMAFAAADFRFCPMCATTVALNLEELSWVISETLLTRRSRQAA